MTFWILVVWYTAIPISWVNSGVYIYETEQICLDVAKKMPEGVKTECHPVTTGDPA